MKRKNIILIHVLFWFYIINQSLFPLYIGKLDEAIQFRNKYLLDVCISFILSIITFYAIYLVFPRLLRFRRKYLAILAGLTVIALITAIRVPAEFYVWKVLIDEPEKSMVFETVYIWNNLRLVIIIGIYAILIHFMINWFSSQKLRDELINQQQASELALMRSQVNPHFLFNTLNNIYSLVYRKSNEAPEALMKFSSIMRYMLYDSASRLVPLEKEIEYLKSILELQSMRFKYPDFVTLQIEGNTEGMTIAPMLLISFVENAFKHGSKNHRPGIIIHLSAEKGTISFEVVNYIKKSTSTADEPERGIGQGMIRRRLELIYPNRHKLQIFSEAETFRINLKITN